MEQYPETAISVNDFLQRFEHPDVLLKSDGIDIYRPTDVPNSLVERIKNDPKAFFEDEKSKFTGSDDKKRDYLEESKFDDEGGATINNNLRVVTEEDLKNNKNALQDK